MWSDLVEFSLRVSLELACKETGILRWFYFWQFIKNVTGGPEDDDSVACGPEISDGFYLWSFLLMMPFDKIGGMYGNISALFFYSEFVFCYCFSINCLLLHHFLHHNFECFRACLDVRPEHFSTVWDWQRSEHCLNIREFTLATPSRLRRRIWPFCACTIVSLSCTRSCSFHM